jgi:hypothetical protein
MKMKKCINMVSPYGKCPLMCECENDVILGYLSRYEEEIDLAKRNGRSIASATDRIACEITSYMNGRIAQVIELVQTRDDK